MVALAAASLTRHTLTVQQASGKQRRDTGDKTTRSAPRRPREDRR